MKKKHLIYAILLFSHVFQLARCEELVNIYYDNLWTRHRVNQTITDLKQKAGSLLISGKPISSLPEKVRNLFVNGFEFAEIPDGGVDVIFLVESYTLENSDHVISSIIVANNYSLYNLTEHTSKPLSNEGKLLVYCFLIDDMNESNVDREFAEYCEENKVK
jgi:hypothetical protein